MPATEARIALRTVLTDAVAVLAERASNAHTADEAALYAKAAADLVSAAGNLVMSGLER